MTRLSRASIAERLKAGRGLREKVARKSHASWKASANRPDPIKLLIDSDAGRIPTLLPIRYGRMRQSPFAFLRGAGAVMAFDLGQMPRTGLRVQACGDCHIMNFGAFASPERNLIFDIDDFDETLPAPWEWDLKRLTVSIEVAGRAAGANRGIASAPFALRFAPTASISASTRLCRRSTCGIGGSISRNSSTKFRGSKTAGAT